MISPNERLLILGSLRDKLVLRHFEVLDDNFFHIVVKRPSKTTMYSIYVSLDGTFEVMKLTKEGRPTRHYNERCQSAQEEVVGLMESLLGVDVK